MCCRSGRVKLDPLPLPPAPLRGLLDYSHPKATLFHQMIKSYNVAFQMTSFGANVTQLGQFPTTFRVQGQVCHRIGSLLPTEGQQPTFLQIYFVGDENDQAERRMQIVSGLDGMIVRELQNMLQNNNELVRIFKTATTNVDLRIQIHSVRPPTGEHPGRYNAPTSNEVAAILVDQGTNNRDIILERHDNRLQRITETHRSYDALQYPLMFCYGTDGYSIDLTLQPAPRQMQRSTTRDIHDHLENADAEETEENAATETNQSTEVAKRGHLTSRMYYAYRIQIRNDPSQHHLNQYRTLFNQYLVDQYAKIETERLLYIRLQQKHLRAGNYSIIDDAFRNDGDPKNLGQLVVLPSSFTGGPRYMQKKDACAYIRKFGRPALFITLTCNPKWTEITETLPFGYKPHERHDVVARIFRLKANAMLKLILNDKIFGPVSNPY